MNALFLSTGVGGRAARAAALVLVAAFLQPLIETTASAESPPLYLLSWGSNGTGDGQFGNPNGIAASGDGFVYVSDTGNDRIQKFTADGVFVLKWGTTGSGPGQFESSGGVTVDPAGNVYVVDGSGRIQKFDANGTFIKSWVSGGMNVAADPTGAYVYLVGGGVVVKYTVEGSQLLTWDVPLATPASFIWGVATAPSGHVYVTVPLDNKVYKYLDGTLVTSWTGTGEGQLDGPRGIAVDGDGNVYVGDVDWMRKYASDGGFLSRWGYQGSLSIGFGSISGVTVDAGGDIYVVDQSTDLVQKFGSPHHTHGENHVGPNQGPLPQVGAMELVVLDFPSPEDALASTNQQMGSCVMDGSYPDHAVFSATHLPRGMLIWRNLLWQGHITPGSRRSSAGCFLTASPPAARKPSRSAA